MIISIYSKYNGHLFYKDGKLVYKSIHNFELDSTLLKDEHGDNVCDIFVDSHKIFYDFNYRLYFFKRENKNVTVRRKFFFSLKHTCEYGNDTYKTIVNLDSTSLLKNAMKIGYLKKAYHSMSDKPNYYLTIFNDADIEMAICLLLIKPLIIDNHTI